jgi:putative exporter of polyketide antibiotics
MQRVFGFVGHLIASMLKGFIFSGVAAALVCTVVLFVTEPNHQVTFDTARAFGLVIALLAGIVGAAVALIYHLSHLDGLHHAAQRYSEMRAEGQRREAHSVERR